MTEPLSDEQLRAELIQLREDRKKLIFEIQRQREVIQHLNEHIAATREVLIEIDALSADAYGPRCILDRCDAVYDRGVNRWLHEDHCPLSLVHRFTGSMW
jgi:hypothetical protein